MRRYPLIAAALCVLATGGAAAQSAGPRKDTVVRVPTGDPAMEKAFARARATLPDFLAAMAHPGPEMENFSVKIAFPTSRRGQEFIWMAELEERDGMFEAVVANMPDDAPGVHEGDKVHFPRSAIADWMYFDSGRMIGNFTACAMMARESAAEQDRFLREYRLDCTE